MYLLTLVSDNVKLNDKAMPTKMKCLTGNEKRIIATVKFIKENKLELKSEEEILERFKREEESDSFMNFGLETLMDFLSFENAKPFLLDEYVKKCEEGKEEWSQVITIKETAQDFLDYMVFAWKKAQDERGISAGRSVQKLATWLWIMNREDLSELIEKESLYNPYGAPALIEVCDKMNIAVPNSLISFAGVKC